MTFEEITHPDFDPDSADLCEVARVVWATFGQQVEKDLKEKVLICLDDCPVAEPYRILTVKELKVAAQTLLFVSSNPVVAMVRPQIMSYYKHILGVCQSKIDTDFFDEDITNEN